ncbi:MAG: hypothetical protein U1E15_00600 [Hyphomicrobiales bacterium]
MKKTLIAFAAAATMAAGMAATASTAEAKVHLDVHVGLPGYGYGGGYYPVYDGPYFYDDGPGCGYEWVKHKKWIHGHKKVWFTKEYVCG